jgi:hypothetical protein
MQIIANIVPDVVNGQPIAIPAGFQAAVNAACSFYDQLFSNPVVLNITFTYAPVPPNVAALNGPAWGMLNYQTVRADLAAHASSADQKVAVGTLPATFDPTQGGTFRVEEAEAKAWGLSFSDLQNPQLTADGSDGIVTLGVSSSWNFDPTRRGTSNTTDAIGVLEHEISEVMGRNGDLGVRNTINHNVTYSPLDLFRYTIVGGVAQRSLTPGPGSFSIDGKNFLQAYHDPTSGGDATDWDTVALGNNAYDAYGPASSHGLVSRTDIREMNIIGWDVANQTVAQVQSLYAANPAPGLSLPIVDNAANVSQGIDALQSLVQNGAIGAINITDPTPILTINSSQLISDASVLSLINGSYDLSVDMVGPLTYQLPNNVPSLKLTGSGDAVVTGSAQSDEFDIEAQGNHTIRPDDLSNNLIKSTAGTTTLDYSGNTAGIDADLQNGWVLKNWQLGTGSPKDTFSGVQAFKGGKGDDVFVSAAGNYAFDGGGGHNSADYHWDSAGMRVDLQAGTVWKGEKTFKWFHWDQGTDQVSRIQDFRGGSGNNTFVSSLNDNYTLDGGSGGTNTLDYSWDTQAVTVDQRTQAGDGVHGRVTKGYVGTYPHVAPRTDSIADFEVFDGGSGGTTFIASVEPAPPSQGTGTGGTGVTSFFIQPITPPSSVSCTFNGGAGLNTLDYSKSDAAIAVTINLETDTVQKTWEKGATPVPLTTDSFSNIQDFVGGSWAAQNKLIAGPGAHAFNGVGKASTVIFHGAVSEYALSSYTGSDGALHTRIVDQGGAGDGTLDVENVGTLQFTDHAYSQLALLGQYTAGEFLSATGVGAVVTAPFVGSEMAGPIQMANGGYGARGFEARHA